MTAIDRAWVYILSNHTNTTLYVGVTSNLENRVAQHKSHTIDGFTKRYCIDKLVYCEEFQSMNDAIACEKKIKGWSRAKKNALIDSMNPTWKDLFEE